MELVGGGSVINGAYPVLFKYYYRCSDADSTYKQAIMLYGAYMHRVGLSLKKSNVLNEAT